MSAALATGFAELIEELAAGPGRLSTSGFEPAPVATSDGRPAFFIELEPEVDGAAPVAFAFDHEALIYVSAGDQGAHFEHPGCSVSEAVAFVSEVANAVVAGRYRERASRSRLLRFPRVELEALREDGSCLLRTRYTDITRDQPFEDRDYLPYR